MRVVFRFGVYIVTESVMGLWWFRWIVFSFSCIGLATSFTSSKSYCIKSFLFSYQIVLLWILQMLYQITSKSFLFASDSTHEYGDEMPTHETACCITIAFWETRKIVGTWFEIILSAMWIAKPWRTFVVFCWSVSYADYFLMFVFHVIFYSVQPDTAFLAVVAFFPDFVLIFYFFQSGWSVLWPSKIFQTLELFSHGVHFNKTKSAWPEQLVFWFLMFFLI